MTSEPQAASAQRVSPPLGLVARLIFGSRWLQLPLYVGLIVAQAVHVLLFLKELWHLTAHWFDVNEQQIMLTVLGLIDGTTRSNFTETGVMWQALIHLTFIISAVGIAWVDRLGDSGQRREAGRG